MTHAREWATHETMLYMAEHLTTQYATDPKVKRIVDNSVVWLIPIVNPDGYAFSWTNIRMWRKNRRINPVSNCTNNPNTSTCCGVDLNRNYAFNWGFDTQGSSGNACAETYRGPSAASEPETVAIQNLVAQQKFAVSVSYHSYSQLWLFSWGYTTQATPESFTSMRAMARKLSELVADTHGLTYVHGQSSYTIYRTNGDFNDFAYGQHGVLSFTPEVRPRTSAEGGFLLPEAQILACAEENLAAALWLMENVADVVDLRKPDDSPLFDTVGVNQTLSLSLPATPTRQRPTESIGLPDAFRGQLLTLQDDALHIPPAWGAFPADYEGCGTGSGYELHVDSEADLAAWANGVVTYRALPHIFEDGADVMLSNVEPELNVIGIPSHLPVALADVSIIRRKLDAATTDFGVTENVLETRSAWEDANNASPWINWTWEYRRPDGTTELAHPTGAGGADTHVFPFRAYRVQVNVPSYQFGSTQTSGAVYLLRFPASALDCNRNGILDTLEIADLLVNDCNGDGIPDECQLDCNANGYADECDPVLSDIDFFVSQLLSASPDPIHFCLIDMNADSVLDGKDLQLFVDRLLSM